MTLTTAPVVADSSVSVLSKLFATQTGVPSEETPLGIKPTLMVLTTGAVEADS